MKIRYHGHSCVEIHGKGTTIIIDPFITGNPHTKTNVEELDVDYIYVTHGHGDHLGDAITIAKRTGATIIAPYELATYVGWEGTKTHPLHIGGSHSFDFGSVKATFAVHGSAVTNSNTKEIVYLGMPSGVIIELDNKKIYHAGDTGLFGDMKLLERENLDVAFLPIGDNFTMGPKDALIAAEWIKAEITIPIHYNTFPIIMQNPEDFVDALKKQGHNSRVLPIDQWVNF